MKRLQCDGALWHVFARGTRRLELFRDDEDYGGFMDLLGFGLWSSDCKLWAYAIMTNHYHLIVESSTQALSQCMHRVNGMYARYHNRRYGLVGHIFDGPYQAYRQRSLLLSLATTAYVFLNPVKAGICVGPEDYRWSGYRSFVGLQGSPLEIDPTPLMHRIDADPKRAWDRFHEAMRRESRRPPKQIAGRPTMVDVHLSQFGWLLEHAREHAALMGGEDPIVVAIYWARQAGIAPRVMAKALGMKGTTVRNLLCSFKARIEKEPSLARLSTIP